MDAKLLKAAHEKIPSVPVLVNLISKRERELINGAKPLVNPQTLLTEDDIRKGRSALDVDERGRIKLSRKAAMAELDQQA